MHFQASGYKKAWPLEKIIGLIKEKKEKHFDPSLVSVFLDHLDKVIEIRNRYPDSFVQDQETVSVQHP